MRVLPRAPGAKVLRDRGAMAATVDAIAMAAAAAVVIGTAIAIGTATIAMGRAMPRAVPASHVAMNRAAILRAASSPVMTGRDATNHAVTSPVARSHGASSRAMMHLVTMHHVAMNRVVTSRRAKRLAMPHRKPDPMPMAHPAMAMAMAATWVARDSTVPRVNAANALDAHAEVAVVAVGVAPAVMAAWARMPRIMAPRMAIEPSLRVM